MIPSPIGSLVPAIAALALSATAPIVPAVAQSPAGPLMEQGETEIVVTGFSKNFRLKGKQLAAALAAFGRNRPRLAPASQLFFVVKSESGGDLSGLELSLRSPEREIPLPLDAQSRFVLPPLPDADWALVANRRKGSIAISPTVLSPGTSEGNRLLGDLRLQCEVSWAMFKSEISVFERAMFSSAGGCGSRQFAFYVTTRQSIAEGRVADRERSLPLRLWGKNSYRAPIGEKTIPNDARVVLTLR